MMTYGSTLCRSAHSQTRRSVIVRSSTRRWKAARWLARVRSGPPSRGNQSASRNSPSRPASTSNRLRAQRSGVGAFASPYWWAIRSTSACWRTCGAGSGGQDRWSPKYAMSASCLASDRYRRGAVMSLVAPGPSCFSGPAAQDEQPEALALCLGTRAAPRESTRPRPGPPWASPSADGAARRTGRTAAPGACS